MQIIIACHFKFLRIKAPFFVFSGTIYTNKLENVILSGEMNIGGKSYVIFILTMSKRMPLYFQVIRIDG